jgi:NADPH2:quinone reductase
VSGYQAIQVDRYGPADVLRPVQVEARVLLPNEVRVRTLYAGVNYTDLQIRAGHWPIRAAQPFPYTPGVEVVGVIAEIGADVRGWSAGQTVISMMQGLGGVRAERPGGYSELVTVDADAIALVPDTVDPLAMATLGLPAVTAYQGLRRLGDLNGRRILVTGAAGGVGSAAVAIASTSGALVSGLVTRDEQAAYVRSLGAQDVVVAPKITAPALGAATYDGILDVVGGQLFGPCVNALRDHGVLSLVGAVNGGDVAFDAWQLIRPVILTGYSTENLEGASLRESIAVLSRLIASGALPQPRHRLFPISQAAQAHQSLEQGGAGARTLLTGSALK